MVLHKKPSGWMKWPNSLRQRLASYMSAGSSDAAEVPRYFFNFETDGKASGDLVGMDLPDDEAAKSNALTLAADLGVDGAIEGNVPSFEWIEVVDEDNRAVARLPVREIIREPNRIT
jgi:hypothetical protein